MSAAIEPPPLRAPVTRLLADPSGVLWMVINGWLGEVETNRFTLPKLQGEPSGQMAMSALNMSKSGRLWLGGNSGYVAAFSHGAMSVLPLVPERLTDNVWEVWEARNGEVWIGSNGGGLSVRRQGAFAPAYLNYLLDNECIWSVLAARDGALWIGTWSSGLFRKTDSKLEQFNVAQQDGDEPVLALCEDRAGGLWVGTYQDGLGSEFIRTLYADAEGVLWIGTGGGLADSGRGAWPRSPHDTGWWTR